MAANAGVEPLDPVKLLLAIFLPPVGVAMEVGLGMHFWINIVLTLFGFIPGIVHAVYVIFSR
ncbi:Proteolipid membrane potential modulator [Pseudobythopirellula maris]|uniref:Proteolipid membrane potential modulator n=1 Tax=Pseudobythopirellula maris TaxID=2527991 RepID=A0A5C5ZSC5_9BACT|nr:YqaE/Pmp3 family membrane protein [Pseudobythopirellula maris]TWT90136.1 Proteolipid membrane potential modulator [Pseudobythopirellula maris]